MIINEGPTLRFLPFLFVFETTTTTTKKNGIHPIIIITMIVINRARTERQKKRREKTTKKQYSKSFSFFLYSRVFFSSLILLFSLFLTYICPLKTNLTNRSYFSVETTLNENGKCI